MKASESVSSSSSSSIVWAMSVGGERGKVSDGARDADRVGVAVAVDAALFLLLRKSYRHSRGDRNGEELLGMCDE